MTTLAELTSHLQQELGICRRLLTILKLTRQTLSKHDPSALEACIQQQANLAEELNAAETQRQALVTALAPAYGLPEDASLLMLATALPDGTALTALTHDLAGVLAEIAQIQTVNHTLLSHALDWVDFNMELVAQLERQTEAPTTYAPPAFAAATSAYRDTPASSVLNLNA